MKVLIPISRFQKAFAMGSLGVEVLIDEVFEQHVQIIIDTGCTSEELQRFLRWCIESGGAREAIYDPLTPDGQVICGNPQSV